MKPFLGLGLVISHWCQQAFEHGEDQSSYAVLWFAISPLEVVVWPRATSPGDTSWSFAPAMGKEIPLHIKGQIIP